MRKHLEALLCLLGLLVVLGGCNKVGFLSKKQTPEIKPPSDIVIFKNIRVFPNSQGEEFEDVFLVFEKNKILKITKSLIEVAHYENAQILDGTNKTLIPKFLTDTLPPEVRQSALERQKHIAEESGAYYAQPLDPADEDREGEGKVVTMSDELVSLVNHGLTPREALRVATIEVAKNMDQESKGYLTEGGEVDFIVISGNPLVDINRIHFIFEIWEEGRLLFHDEAHKSSEPPFQSL